MLLKFSPIWFSDTAHATLNTVLFDGRAVNALIGSSINTAPSGETEMSVDAPLTANLVQGGITANAQAAMAVVVTSDVLIKNRVWSVRVVLNKPLVTIPNS